MECRPKGLLGFVTIRGRIPTLAIITKLIQYDHQPASGKLSAVINKVMPFRMTKNLTILVIRVHCSANNCRVYIFKARNKKRDLLGVFNIPI